MKIPYKHRVDEIAEDITATMEDITLLFDKAPVNHQHLPREVSLVLTKLEEALLWLSKVPAYDPD